jgi:hypothetical protein
MWCKRPARLYHPHAPLHATPARVFAAWGNPGAAHPLERSRQLAGRGGALVLTCQGVMLDEGDEIRNREEGGASILDKLGDSLA